MTYGMTYDVYVTMMNGSTYCVKGHAEYEAAAEVLQCCRTAMENGRAISVSEPGSDEKRLLNSRNVADISLEEAWNPEDIGKLMTDMEAGE